MSAQPALRRAALFKEFTDAGIAIFATIAVEKTVPGGTPLFVEAMAGESLFIVESGTVRIVQRTAEGERLLGTARAGDHLGALALLAPSVRLVTAVAEGDCVVLEFRQRDFARLQPLKPQACLKLALAIAADVAAQVAANGAQLRELAPGRGEAGGRGAPGGRSGE